MKSQSLPTKVINKHKLSIKIPCMFAERGSYTTPAASSVLTDINCGSCTAVDLKKNKMEISKYVVISYLKSFYDVCKILLPHNLCQESKNFSQ